MQGHKGRGTSRKGLSIVSSIGKVKILRFLNN